MTRSKDGEEDVDRFGSRDGDALLEAAGQPSARSRHRPRRTRLFVLALLGLCGVLGYLAFEHRATNRGATEKQQDAQDDTPEVTAITAKADNSPLHLTLPGQTEPFYTASIYPRATGYVAERRVDIGSRVKKGDLLIRIAAPDLDAQLAQSRAQHEQSKAAGAQARAQTAQAEANLALAQVTSKRFQTLTKRGYETVQNNDNQSTQVQSQQANVEMARAGVKVAKANTQGAGASLKRPEAQIEFERVVAPFDGVITTRGVEVGDLVTADNQSGAPLFTMAADDVVRVAVHVPQVNAFAIREGLVGEVRLPQMPNEVFTGKIARNSVALLNSARTLDAEVDVRNPAGKLKPGAYVNVSFDVPRERPKVSLPTETLIFDQNGLHVATVGNNEVHMVPVAIYRDFGKTVELRGGLAGGEQVVFNPPPDLVEHSKVKLKEKPPQD